MEILTRPKTLTATGVLQF